MITGLNHITISVRNLEESFRFYKDVLRIKPLMRAKRVAYFAAGDLWFCLDEDPHTRTRELPEYTHIAFSVTPDDFENASACIKESGAKIWKENESEGASLYFLDPNPPFFSRGERKLQKLADPPPLRLRLRGCPLGTRLLGTSWPKKRVRNAFGPYPGSNLLLSNF